MNRAYQRSFAPNELTLGIMSPIESYRGNIPKMVDQLQLVQKAESYGFSSIWVRDIPLNDPHFGDAGQMYDPFIYLSHLASHTSKINLATASIILPFRHPIDVAKSIRSLNNLSQGRLLLGIATGDRPLEYAAFGKNYNERSQLFQESLYYINDLLKNDFPTIHSPLGSTKNLDLQPKSEQKKVPLLITGYSQQELPWIAQHSDGWIYYPQNISSQERRVRSWQETLHSHKHSFKPFLQSLYIDLDLNEDAQATPIHLGYRLGVKALIKHIQSLKAIGVNHVILNLKYAQRSAHDILDELGQKLLPLFQPLN